VPTDAPATRAHTFYLVAVGVSVVLLWAQFLLTSRWAHIDGALHGPKRPYYLVALVVASIALVTGWSTRSSPLGRLLPALALGCGIVLLGSAFFVWFPVATWTEIPYLDNWATRYQSTMDGIALLKQGAAVGWNWDFLGGYHTASDITQSLTALAWLPVAIFGDTLGWHVLHALLFASIPALVYADLRLDGDRPLAALAAGLTCVTTAGFSYLLLRSGDTNSLAGLSTTMLAIVAAHAAARGRRWGSPLLVVAMAAVAWSHTGFVMYAALFLLIDAAMARDWRRAGRAVFAVVCGAIGALPLTWELWQYPEYFIPNNVIFDPAQPIDWAGMARRIYYATELLWLPGRWVNDFAGLTNVLLPILAFTAWRIRGRARFHAVGAIVVVLLMRLNTPEFAYVFLRPIHLLSVFTPVAIAGFLTQVIGSTWRRVAVAAMVAIYLQIWWHTVPHIPGVDAVEPALVARIGQSSGALVLIENTSHRDMDADPAVQTEKPPMPVHFESLLPRLTGKRFYGGMWDGWQWTPERDRVLAAGAFRGRALSVTPSPALQAELSAWGVRSLFVWSQASRAYFAADPAFVEVWRGGDWVEFSYPASDSRPVVVPYGRAQIIERSPLGARLLIQAQRKYVRVVLRTNYFPAWTASIGGTPVALVDEAGQLAFDAPVEGEFVVDLQYPRRTWLLIVSMFVVVAGAIAAAFVFNVRL